MECVRGVSRRALIDVTPSTCEKGSSHGSWPSYILQISFERFVEESTTNYKGKKSRILEVRRASYQQVVVSRSRLPNGVVKAL